MGILHAFLILSALESPSGPPNPPSHQVQSLRVTVLSTMLTDLHGTGEWGFSALVDTVTPPIQLSSPTSRRTTGT